MGCVVEGKFVYYQTPRTGSNAVRTALIKDRRPLFVIGQHMDYREMTNAWPRLKGMEGVCNIRNPFDILASWLFHHRGFHSIREMLKDNTARDFVRRGLLCYHVPHCKFLIRHGPTMKDQLNDILNHYKCKPIKRLLLENVSPDRPPYQEVYTWADIDAVRERFQSELDNLNYDFEGEPLG